MVTYILIGALLVALVGVRLFGKNSANDDAKIDAANENRKQLKAFERDTNFFKHADEEKVRAYVNLLTARQNVNNLPAETKNKIANCISRLIPGFLETIEDYKLNRLPSNGVENLKANGKEVRSEIRNDYDSFGVVAVVAACLTKKLRKDSTYLNSKDRQRDLKNRIREIENAII